MNSQSSREMQNHRNSSMDLLFLIVSWPKW